MQKLVFQGQSSLFGHSLHSELTFSPLVFGLFSPITTHFKPPGIYKPGDDYINFYGSDSLISTPNDTWWPTRSEENSQNVFGWTVMKLFFKKQDAPVLK